jgi:hypothetical protein
MYRTFVSNASAAPGQVCSRLLTPERVEFYKVLATIRNHVQNSIAAGLLRALQCKWNIGVSARSKTINFALRPTNESPPARRSVAPDNVLTVPHLLGAAKECGCAAFVLTSSEKFSTGESSPKKLASQAVGKHV